MGCLFIVSCSEEFITKDLDKSKYVASTFYNTKAHALQALTAAYSQMNGSFLWSGNLYIMANVMSDDLYQTAYCSGNGQWGPVTDFNLLSTYSEFGNAYYGLYANILNANNALEVMPGAQEVANDATFTTAVLDSYMGQAYYIRAISYYFLYLYWPQDKLVLRRTVPTEEAEYYGAPVPKDSIYAFMVSDLQKAETLLAGSLNTTSGYDKGRITRGSAAALLGKLYLNEGLYQKAADEFIKILPGVGDAAYGSYSLVNNYRANFTNSNENNSESLFEVQFANVNNSTSGNECSGFSINWTLNRTSWSKMYWNFAIPSFRLNEFENWTETIGGTSTTVYDYRAYQTFWGVPNGANFTDNGTVKDWKAQGWSSENVSESGLSSIKGVYGMRKLSYDNTSEVPTGVDPGTSDINVRVIRLSDIMLLYAECMANLNPGNLTATDTKSAIYWVDQVRTRANKPMTDQSNLYSARSGVSGQLPSATSLMTSKGWTLQRLIEHERCVELYGEAWRGEDIKRWKKGSDYILYKSGWKGYESLTLPIPQTEIDRNPNFQ